MWIGLVCLYGVFKGCKRYNKEKGNGEKQCYGGAVFSTRFISFLFVTPSVKNALSIDFSLYRICNDKISYNFYSLDMQF